MWWQGPWAGLVMDDRRVAAEGIMGALAVVAEAVARKLLGTVREVAPGMAGEELQVQGAMKAFILALSLGMIGAAVQDADA